jgi:hypothetical protein
MLWKPLMGKLTFALLNFGHGCDVVLGVLELVLQGMVSQRAISKFEKKARYTLPDDPWMIS